MVTKAEVGVADASCLLLMVFLRPPFPMPIELWEAFEVWHVLQMARHVLQMAQHLLSAPPLQLLRTCGNRSWSGHSSQPKSQSQV